jgi:hypothetical protein
MLRQRSSLLVDQPLTIYEPNLLSCLIIAQPMQPEVTHQLLRNAHTRATCTQEQDPMRFRRRATRCSGREPRGVDEAGEDNSAGALDVVIEDRVRVAEAVEICEGVVCGKVFELDEELGEGGFHLAHEFIHEFVHLFVRNTAAAKTEVERVIEELLVVGAEVEADRDCRRWANAVLQNNSAG